MPCPPTIVEPLCIPRGATFKKIFDVYDCSVEPNVPIDLSDRDWRAQVRSTVSSPTVLADWNSTGAAPVPPNPVIFIEDIPSEPAGNNGRLRIEVGATVTEGYLWNGGEYDIEGELKTDVDDVWRLAQGDVEVDPDVTRPPPP